MTNHQASQSLLDEALNEWRRLMLAEIRLRERIHHQHRLIIAELETPHERAEMTAKLAEANRLLSQLKTLVGEVRSDALADPRR
ncbi:hypothetical protein EB75_01975 [Mycobacterium sp. ST-F2]|uniref:hypothetical protein n=1 Tax=Mycobacterium sp. ST-F2 TaxID=1490484 RepID=UPI000939539D|nr:hypothetical protein [Mycobacterium sp. ST-F2]OKH76998.1 hypothetical protein EB75_01975 [Mycobacterium sp. ST-F2]